MALSVVMPALEMAQETGKLVSWFKKEGEQVRKGEMLLEVETDKAVVEIEAAGDGILAAVTAQPGDVIQVGRTIAWLVQPGEATPAAASADGPTGRRTDGRPAVVSENAVSKNVGRVRSDPATPAAKAATIAEMSCSSTVSSSATWIVPSRRSPRFRRAATAAFTICPAA